MIQITTAKVDNIVEDGIHETIFVLLQRKVISNHILKSSIPRKIY